MRAIVCTAQGEPVAENIRLVEDWPEPGPAPAGSVTVRTIASALNHMDLWVGRGIPGVRLTWPRVSGCDACGEVVEAGPGVDRAWLGRRVIVNAATRVPDRQHPDDPPGSTLSPNYELIGEHHHGMLRERFHAPAANLADIGPLDASDPSVDAIEAAGFGLVHLTAWSMMVTKGQLRHGQCVLVTGIGGGVATAALGIALAFGCRVAVTSRSADKLERARAIARQLAGEAFTRDGTGFLGVHDTGEDWSKLVREWTNKRGVDMAVDSTGKATHLRCIKSLARGGAYVTPGCTSGPDAVTDLARVFWNQLRLLGSTMGSNEEFGEVVSLLRAGRLRATIDRVYRPEECRDAYRRLEAGEQFGKIVIAW